VVRLNNVEVKVKTDGADTSRTKVIPSPGAASGYGRRIGLSGNVAMMFQAAPSVVVRAASSH
jgi:hypothetical protein